VLATLPAPHHTLISCIKSHPMTRPMFYYLALDDGPGGVAMMDGGALQARAEVNELWAEAEAIGGAEEEEEEEEEDEDEEEDEAEEEEEQAIVRSEEHISDRDQADLVEVEVEMKVEVDSGAGGVVRSGRTALRSDSAYAGLRWAQDTASGVPLEDCVPIPVRYEQTVRVRSSSARGGAGPRPVSRAVPLPAPSVGRCRLTL